MGAEIFISVVGFLLFVVTAIVHIVRLTRANQFHNPPRPARRRRKSGQGSDAQEPYLSARTGALPEITPDFSQTNWNDLGAVYSALPAALKELEDGNIWKGEQIVQDQVLRVGKLLGTENPLYAAAIRGKAIYLIRMGDLVRAVPLLQEACAIPGESRATERERFQYMSDLADVLLKIGRVEEAEDVLEQCLAARKVMYGEQHSGHAIVYGFQAIAHYLQERLDAAHQSISTAIEIHLKKADVELARDSVVLAYILSASGDAETELFPYWDEIQKHKLLLALCLSVADLARYLPPPSSLVVIHNLRSRLMDDPANLEPLKILLTVASHCSKAARDSKSLVAFVEEYLEISQDKPKQRLTALLGLANAYDDNRQPENCEAAYEEATAVAKEMADLELECHVHIQHANWLAKVGQNDRAREQYRQAMEAGQSAEKPEILGIAASAFGTFLHHCQDYAEAAKVLASVTGKLPLDHPLAVEAENHLTCAELRVDCDCREGGLSTARLQALRTLQTILPEDLVKAVRIDLNGGGKPLSVELSRKPKPEEEALLDHATFHVWAVIRHSIGNENN